MHSLINPMYQVVEHLGWGKISDSTFKSLNFKVLSESYVKAQQNSNPDKSADPSLDELVPGKATVPVKVTGETIYSID